MNVKELIDKLQSLPQDLPILLGQNSGGYETCLEVKRDTSTNIFTNEKSDAVFLEID